MLEIIFSSLSLFFVFGPKLFASSSFFFNVLILERKPSVCSGGSASRTIPSLLEFFTANTQLSLVLHAVQLGFIFHILSE